MSLLKSANALISKPHSIREVKFPNGNTADIVNTMLWADGQKIVKEDTRYFADELRGSSDEQTAYNVWEFVKKYVRYQLDPLGIQDIKAPAKTWADGYADCKSRSVFQASLLKNLNIPYGYRFASYARKDIYTHVYVIINVGGKWYKSDPDMKDFNIEKPFKYKLDKIMSKISYVAGTDTKEGRLNLFLPTDQMTDFDMELAIRKQRAEIQKGIAERLAGIGCPHAEKMNDKIDVINDMIEVRSNPNLSEEQKLSGIGTIIEMADRGEYNNAQYIAGIGSIGKKNEARKAKKQERKGKIKDGIKKKKGKFKEKLKKGLKKVAAAAKKVGKGLLKVASAPQRLAAKALLEVSLPKMAPMFLYLFVKDQALIDKLPEAARKKRKKSEKIAKFIINKIGMKEAHFMGIVRNGIMKRYQKSPEEVLNLNLKGKVSGLGDIGFWDAIIKVALKVIQTIFKAFKGKKDKGEEEDTKLSADDMPDPQKDFGNLSPEEQSKLGSEIKQQPMSDPDTSVPGESGNDGSSSSSDGGSVPGESTNSRSTKIC